MNTTTATAAAAGDAPRPRQARSATGVVQQSGLPASLGGLVLAVTGKCGLWRRERVEVARELCAHFLDGLESGATAAELSATFGDPRQAARLITHSRKKLRPLWWRTTRAGLRGIGGLLLACIVVYGFLAARFFLVSPSVSRNYMNELNAPVLGTPVAERAWPMYIEARKQFGPMPEFMLSPNGEPRQPGDEHWDDMVRWLDEHQAAMGTVRAAAAKPVLGFVYRASMDPDLARAMEISNPGYKYEPEHEVNPENPMMIGILLPHLGEMRRYARWLSADANLAASRGESARFLSDIDSMLRMAEQVMQDKFLISTLVAIAIADLTATTIVHEATRSELLSRDELRGLAHRVAAFGGGRVVIDASLEQLTIEDILQRYYSDDGEGDGRYVGGPQMESVYTDFGIARPRGAPLIKAIQPVQSALISSRREIMDKSRRFVAAAAMDDALPPWRHDERSSDALYREIMHSGLYAVVPFLSSLQGMTEEGPVASACAARDIFEAKRDAALVVIAMECYRRVHGAWPASLGELVPAYLPRAPLDPFDGRPLRYVAPASAGEALLLYSVGVDGVDEQGRLPVTRKGRYGVQNLKWLGKFRTLPTMTTAEQQSMDASRGDWVIWPEPPPVVEPVLPDTNPTNAQNN